MNTGIYQFGIMNQEFYIDKIGEKKLPILTKTSYDKKLKNGIYKYVVEKKHIPHLSRIDYMSNAFKDEDQYNVDIDNGVIRSEYSPVNSSKKKNNIIEKYLEERFGKYRGFIKE